MKANIIAAISGTAGALGTAGGIAGVANAISWPTNNLAGYVIAAKILGGGPAVSSSIAAVGGPIVVGAAAVLTVGAVAGALGYGLARVIKGP